MAGTFVITIIVLLLSLLGSAMIGPDSRRHHLD